MEKSTHVKSLSRLAAQADKALRSLQSFVRSRAVSLLVELHQLAESVEPPARSSLRDIARRLEEIEERSTRFGEYLEDRLRQIAALHREPRRSRRDTDVLKKASHPLPE